MKININTLEDTKSLAQQIATLTKKGDIITLQGDLGSGKTEFARSFINSLSESPQEVTSPTFNLVHPYDTKTFTIWHFDLYRLESPEEIEQIGLYDAFDNGVSLIEWPQIIDDILPVDRLLIKISFDDDRVAEVEGRGNWKDRISGIKV
jgi:tRNA threonylcarbamoyladenosine biosynthesis protein TsaE